MRSNVVSKWLTTGQRMLLFECYHALAVSFEKRASLGHREGWEEPLQLHHCAQSKLTLQTAEELRGTELSCNATDDSKNCSKWKIVISSIECSKLLQRVKVVDPSRHGRRRSPRGSIKRSCTQILTIPRC